MSDPDTSLLAQETAPAAVSATPSTVQANARPGPSARKFKSTVGPRQVLAVGAAIAVACWGAWVTKSIAAPPKPETQLVKLQLQGLVSEYLQAQARSGNDDQTAAAATTRFMAELDKTVASLGKSGRVVLVNEAVIGGDIPDITAQVRRSVYTRVPMPKVAVASPVEQDMQAYLAANGGGRASPRVVPEGSTETPGGIAQ